MSSDVVVDIQGLTKRFGARTVFEDISLQVRRSEVVAVIGPSGAGKSTFIRCINYLHPFDAGRIRVLGHELVGGGAPPSKATLRQVRMQVGMAFQTFNLFPHLTALGNVMLGPMETKRVPARDARDKAMALLSSVGLADRAEAYPRRLSGGEQQRVAICRALAMDPEVMLFDEPTSMLDPEMVGEVLATIRGLASQGMTLILVTHEMQFAKEVADTVVVMADGRVVEQGPARDVLEHPTSERSRTFLTRVLKPLEAPGVSGEASPPGGSGRGATTALGGDVR